MSEERYIPLAEVREMMEKEVKQRELTPEQKISLDHASKLSHISAEKANKLMKELLELPFVSDPVAVKIVDLMPMHVDDVRVLFTKERLVLDKKQIEQVIKLVESYL